MSAQAASNIFTVTITDATYEQGGDLSVTGTVTSAGDPATGVTIDLLTSSGSTRLITNHPYFTDTKFVWRGKLPKGLSISSHSQIQVLSNRQSRAVSGISILNPAVDPVVLTLKTKNAPSAPNDKVILICKDNDGKSSNTCPVLSYGGNTYWAFTYKSNKPSYLLAGFDQTGKLVSSVEVGCELYLRQITIDGPNQTVSFWGNNGKSTSLAWTAINQ